MVSVPPDRPPGPTPVTPTNVFLKIIDKQLPASILYEDDRCLAFRDANPQAPVHVLVIPREVIPTHADLQPHHAELVGHLHLVAARVMRELGVAGAGYRVVVNCGDGGGQVVPHLHLHLLAGRAFAWPPG